MIIHLHSYNVSLPFVQIEHIVKYIIADFPKLTSSNQL
jgi:hypothetical protein